MAKGMRSSYMAPNSPPQFPGKQALGVAPSTPSANGVDENRLGVRSPSTSKMITSLQKEMDALKGSSEAARAAAGRFPLVPILIVDAERASREAIQRKCDKLEEIVDVFLSLIAAANARSYGWKTPI
jgi:hypothetical protein